MNTKHLKLRNQRRVLEAIRKHAPVTREELVRITSMSAPTLISALNAFRQLELVQSVGYVDSTGGRPPELMDINEKAGFAVAFWMEVPRIDCAVLDLKSHVLCKESSYLTSVEQVDDNLQEIVDLIRRTIEQAGIDQKALIGIGFAIPGLIDRHANRSLTIERLPGWENVDIAELLSKEFECPVSIDNDIRAAAIAENHIHLQNRYRDFLYVGVFEGIGMGIYSDGLVQMGNRGNAGFLGHTTVVPDGIQCRCGSEGCLEVYSSIAGIRRQIVSTCSRDVLEGIPNEQLQEEHILEAYMNGQPQVVRIVKRANRMLGIGLSNAIKLFDPALIVVGSRCLFRYDENFHEIEDTCRAYLRNYPDKNTTICRSQVHDNPVIVGIGMTVIDSFFDSVIA